MLRISTNLVEPGTVLARPVYDGRGQILLAKGVSLKPNYIQRLKQMGIGALYIDGAFNDLVTYENVIHDQTYMAAVQNTRQLVKMVSSPGKGMDLGKTQKAVENIIEEIIRNREAFLDISAMHDFDDYIFTHSVAVCVLSVIIGMRYNMLKPELQLLGMGALLHDVGKLQLPGQILNKVETLTPEEWKAIRQYPILGFNTLKKSAHLLVAHVAFQHQERYDGSGYPRGIRSQDIHLFGRIAAVADVYDALTSKKPYRDAWPAQKAYEYIWMNSGTLFDSDVVRHFSDTVAIFPNGTIVKLSDGKKALVVKQNTGWPLRPLIFTLNNNQIDKQVDLMAAEHSNLYIVN